MPRHPEDNRLPCRITVDCDGVEWFLYNRTPAYDAILEKFNLETPQTNDESGKASSIHIRQSGLSTTPSRNDADTDDDEINWLKEALPIEIHAENGSIVLGNRSTKSVIVAGFSRVSGAYGAVKVSETYLFFRKRMQILNRQSPVSL
jgi:hypothetical protein